jgi:hypothetical protein
LLLLLLLLLLLRLFITLTLLHLGEDINLLIVSLGGALLLAKMDEKDLPILINSNFVKKYYI